eukprot:scpid49644/ scgid29268/ 
MVKRPGEQQSQQWVVGRHIRVLFVLVVFVYVLYICTVLGMARYKRQADVEARTASLLVKRRLVQPGGGGGWVGRAASAVQAAVGRSNAAASATAASPVNTIDGGPHSHIITKLLEKHARLQADVLAGNVKFSRALIAKCTADDVCAGLGDRVFGILVLYLGAILTDRAFFLEYSKPKPMDAYLEPNALDWRINAIQNDGVRGKVAECALSGSGHFDSCRASAFLMPDQNCGQIISAVFSDRNVLVTTSNHRTDCILSMLVKSGVVPKAEATGKGAATTPEGMRQWAANVSHVLINSLFRFNKEVMEAGNKVVTPRGGTDAAAPLPPECFLCVHVRSGSGVGEKSRHTNFRDFATCGLTAHAAQRLADNTTRCPVQPHWLIVGDSSTAPGDIIRYANEGRNDAEKIALLTTTDLGPATHMDRNNAATDDMVKHVFIDYYLLSRCQYTVASLSTFAATGAIIGGPGVFRYDMEVGGHSGGCTVHRISDWQRDANLPG